MNRCGSNHHSNGFVLLKIILTHKQNTKHNSEWLHHAGTALSEPLAKSFIILQLICIIIKTRHTCFLSCLLFIQAYVPFVLKTQTRPNHTFTGKTSPTQQYNTSTSLIDRVRVFPNKFELITHFKTAYIAPHIQCKQYIGYSVEDSILHGTCKMQSFI